MQASRSTNFSRRIALSDLCREMLHAASINIDQYWNFRVMIDGRSGAVVSSAQSQSAKTTVRSCYLPASIQFPPQFVQLCPSSILHSCTKTLALCDPDLRPLMPTSGCVCLSVMAPVILLVTCLTPNRKRRKERADRYYRIF